MNQKTMPGSESVMGARTDIAGEGIWKKQWVPMNIIMLENNSAIASVLTELIERWGHNVKKVRTGKEALKVFDQDLFDLALLDIFLPDIQGYELIPQLKNLNPEIGIIAMASYNTPELEIKLRERGIWNYMIKPF